MYSKLVLYVIYDMDVKIGYIYIVVLYIVLLSGLIYTIMCMVVCSSYFFCRCDVPYTIWEDRYVSCFILAINLVVTMNSILFSIYMKY